MSQLIVKAAQSTRSTRRASTALVRRCHTVAHLQLRRRHVNKSHERFLTAMPGDAPADASLVFPFIFTFLARQRTLCSSSPSRTARLTTLLPPCLSARPAGHLESMFTRLSCQRARFQAVYRIYVVSTVY